MHHLSLLVNMLIFFSSMGERKGQESAKGTLRFICFGSVILHDTSSPTVKAVDMS